MIIRIRTFLFQKVHKINSQIGAQVNGLGTIRLHYLELLSFQFIHIYVCENNLIVVALLKTVRK